MRNTPSSRRSHCWRSAPASPAWTCLASILSPSQPDSDAEQCMQTPPNSSPSSSPQPSLLTVPLSNCRPDPANDGPPWLGRVQSSSLTRQKLGSVFRSKGFYLRYEHCLGLLVEWGWRCCPRGHGHFFEKLFLPAGEHRHSSRGLIAGPMRSRSVLYSRFWCGPAGAELFEDFPSFYRSR